MKIEVTAVKREEKEILLNLMEKYEYELSQYYHYNEVNELGLYDLGNANYIDSFYHENAKRWVFFIKADGKLAGFAMILGDEFCLESRKADYYMSDFFVMYKYRGLGVGKFAANYLFDKFKGVWQTTVCNRNTNAVLFWLKAIGDYTGGKFELLPSEGVDEDEPGDEKNFRVFHFSTDK